MILSKNSQIAEEPQYLQKCILFSNSHLWSLLLKLQTFTTFGTKATIGPSDILCSTETLCLIKWFYSIQLKDSVWRGTVFLWFPETASPLSNAGSMKLGSTATKATQSAVAIPIPAVRA